MELVTVQVIVPLLVLAVSAGPVNKPRFIPAQYKLIDDLTESPNTFFHSFTAWNSSNDPTGDGSSAYLGLPAAIDNRLVAFVAPSAAAPAPSGGAHNILDADGSVIPNTPVDITEFSPNVPIYVGVDYTTENPKNGRNAMRLTGTKQYNAGTLFVMTTSHMPSGCGLWPAYWLVNTDPGNIWPNGGEIDIIENVNQASGNQMTLHTNAGCRLNAAPGATGGSAFTGKILTSNCDVKDPSQSPNAGCGISAPDGTFGAPFNAAGGGTYVTEWTSTAIHIWFFPAGSPQFNALNSASASPDTSTFGTPLASWSTASGCNIGSYFKDLSIVINTEICGQWAGQPGVWASSGCQASTGMATCKEYAMKNAAAFRDAYWRIDGLRVYGSS